MLYYDIATLAAIVALKSADGKTSLEVAAQLGMSPSQVDRIYDKAIKRGF